MDWNYIQAHWDWAGHILEALVMAAIVALLMRIVVKSQLALIVGFAFAAGHFHGREKRDYEIAVAMPPPHLDAYYVWRWSWDQATDFWPAAIICFAFILFLSMKMRGSK